MTENTEPTEIIEPTEIETPTPSYKKELIIGAAVVVAVLAIIAAIALVIYNSTPKVDYEPTAACSTLTTAEARELLGDNAFNANTNEPIISGNTATSRCGYTDGNANTQDLIVAAVIVRSGINDNGVEQNKIEFANGTPTQGVEIVTGLGDSAYFNQVNGQLNVLKGRNWFILSNGLGTAPEANTLEDVTALALKVV